MRDLSTLYDGKVTGAGLDVKAKDASTETAFDGSPSLAINIDDLTFGPLQRLLNFVGQTPDGQPETKDLSQLFDAMREAFNTPEFQQISASGPVVFGKTNHQIELDVSIGNIDIDALALADFLGQHVHFYAVGSGIGSIAGGNGVYVNDIFITENTGGAHLWGVDGGLWKADNGVTADYTESATIVRQSTSGKFEFLSVVIVVGSIVFTYPITISSTIGVLFSILDGVSPNAYSIYTTGVGPSSMTIVAVTAGEVASTRQIHVRQEGSY